MTRDRKEVKGTERRQRKCGNKEFRRGMKWDLKKGQKTKLDSWVLPWTISTQNRAPVQEWPLGCTIRRKGNAFSTQFRPLGSSYPKGLLWKELSSTISMCLSTLQFLSCFHIISYSWAHWILLATLEDKQSRNETLHFKDKKISQRMPKDVTQLSQEQRLEENQDFLTHSTMLFL